MPQNKTVLTVTLNPAIDRMLDIPDFRLGYDNRGLGGASFAGGKGINVSRALKNFGLNSVICGFAGGANGQNFLRDLLLEGFEHNFVFIQGETRINLTIRDPKNGRITRVIERGPVITKKDLLSFRDKYRRLAAQSQWVVLSGRRIEGTPKSFYGELVKFAVDQDRRVIVDVSGQDLLAALKAKPFLVKVNREEASEVLEKKIITHRDFKDALKQFRHWGAQNVVITLGEDGAVAAPSDGKVFYQLRGPKVKAVNAVGCGDALTAGLIAGFERTDDFLEALVCGVAAGTASCLTRKPGELRRGDYARFLSKIVVAVL